MSETPTGLPPTDGIKTPEQPIPGREFGSYSEAANGKPQNEDYSYAGEVTLGDGTKVGLIAVADGVSQSGYGKKSEESEVIHHAHEASRKAITVLQQLLQQPDPPLQLQTSEDIINLLIAVNRQVTEHFIKRDEELAQQHGITPPYFRENGLPATALAFGIVFPEGYLHDAFDEEGRPINALFGSVGDSDIYYIPSDGEIQNIIFPPDNDDQHRLNNAVGMRNSDDFERGIMTVNDRPHVRSFQVEPGSILATATDGFRVSDIIKNSLKPSDKSPLSDQCINAVIAQIDADKELQPGLNGPLDDVTIAAMRV